MKKILLVEPDYKNKVPPIELMKISTFHKEYTKDYVKFIRGICKKNTIFKEWDRIYIATFFIFDYDIVIKTIKFYKQFVSDNSKIIIIGMMANLQPDNIFKDTGIYPLIGQLFSASLIGYPEFSHINIDNLILDYDILYEVEDKYFIFDSYFISTSKNYFPTYPLYLTNKFESFFYEISELKKYLEETEKKYGPKKNLTIINNDILSSENLKEELYLFKSMGFIPNKKTFETPLKFKWILRRIERREQLTALSYKKEIFEDIDRIMDEFKEQKKALNSDDKLRKIFTLISKENNYWNKLKHLKFYKIYIETKLNFYKRKSKAARTIDFSQGFNPKFLNEEKIKWLSEIPIKSYKIAFSDISLKNTYINIIKLINKYGAKYFSNYILYNYEDKPEDFWERIYINIQLAEKLKLIDLFCSPIKYSPIMAINKKFIGKYWTKTQISNLHAILNAQHGIIPKNKEYFFIAFGRNKNEFLNLLSYPRDFIIFRTFFKSIGYTEIWENFYKTLSETDRIRLYEYFENKNFDLNSLNNIFKDGLFLLNIKKEKLDFVKNFLDSNNLEYTYETIFHLLNLIFVNKIKSKVKITNFLKLHFLHR